MTFYRFTKDGTVEEFPGDPVVNDLTKVPYFEDTFPENTVALVIATNSADGSTPRLAFLSPKMIMTSEEISSLLDTIKSENVSNLQDLSSNLDNIKSNLEKGFSNSDTEIKKSVNDNYETLIKLISDNKELIQSRQDETNDIVDNNIETLQNQSEDIKNMIDSIAKTAKPTILGSVTVSQKATTVGLGARTELFEIDCDGVKLGEPVYVYPTSGIKGYAIGSAFCTKDNVVSIPVVCPALTLGGKFSFDAKVQVFR